MTPLPWIGSTMKAATWRDDSACSSAARSLNGICVQSRQQRLEAVAEIRVAVQRQRAVGQAVKRVVAVHDAGAAGRAARELDRGLDGLGAGIGKEHLVEIRHVGQQPLGQHAGKRRHVQLHEIGQIAVEHAFQRVAQRRMVAPDRKHAKAAQQIEIAVAVAVEQILTVPRLKADVVADGLQHPDHLLVQMARMHGTSLRLPLYKQPGNV